MGTDFSIRPVGAPVATPVIRPTPDAASGGGATQVAPGQGTTAPNPSAAANNDARPDSGQGSSGQVAHEVIIDRAAGSIVYRVIDTSTSQVISQYPDDARLRARAYLRTIEDAKLDKSSQVKLDHTA